MDREAVRALVERQARAWERADLDAIVADFADDGALISPGGHFQGPAAIRAAAEAFFEQLCDVRVEIMRVLLDGDAGAVEWTWSETRRADGRRATMEDGIVFTLRGDRIVRWREYFDTAATHG